MSGQESVSVLHLHPTEQPQPQQPQMQPQMQPIAHTGNKAFFVGFQPGGFAF